MKIQEGKIYYEKSLNNGKVFYYCIEKILAHEEAVHYYDLEYPYELYYGDIVVCERYWKEVNTLI